MSDTRKSIIDFIIEVFAVLANQIEIANCLNLQDRNIHLENDFRDLLNLIYDDRIFRNLNTDTLNNAAIDLGDNLNDISIQITSTTSTQKVKDTIEKFQGQYNSIVMLYCVTKKPRRTTSFDDLLDKNTKLEEWDLSDLITKINDLPDGRLNSVNGLIKSKFITNLNQIISDISGAEEWLKIEPEDVRNIEDKLRDVCIDIRQSRINQYCREIASGNVQLKYYPERNISAMKFRIFEVCQDELNSILERKKTNKFDIEEIKAIITSYTQRAIEVISYMSTDYNYPLKSESSLRKIVLALIDECYLSFDEKGLYGE